MGARFEQTTVSRLITPSDKGTVLYSRHGLLICHLLDHLRDYGKRLNSDGLDARWKETGAIKHIARAPRMNAYLIPAFGDSHGRESFANYAGVNNWFPRRTESVEVEVEKKNKKDGYPLVRTRHSTLSFSLSSMDTRSDHLTGNGVRLKEGNSLDSVSVCRACCIRHDTNIE